MKPVRPPHVVFPHRTPQQVPPPVQGRGKIQKRGSFFGAGCALQGAGLFCLVAAAGALIYFDIISSGFFGLLGLWLLIYGRRKATWRECSLCGGKLAHPRVRLCPHCRSNLSPG